MVLTCRLSVAVMLRVLWGDCCCCCGVVVVFVCVLCDSLSYVVGCVCIVCCCFARESLYCLLVLRVILCGY